MKIKVINDNFSTAEIIRLTLWADDYEVYICTSFTL